MAEVQDPYAQFDAAKGDPYAAFDTPNVAEASTLKDVAKTIAPSALRGTLSLLTTPGSLDDLLGKGARWTLNKVAPESSLNKAVQSLMAIDTDKNGKSISDQHSFFPSYSTALDKVEAKTGPLYEAQTPVGKAAQGAIEIAPAFAGGGIPSLIAKSIGAGVGGELGSEGGEALAPYLPESAQKFAQPVGKVLGNVAGMLSPSAARRAVTPLPLEGEQAATVAALRARNPELVDASTAGQLSASPRLQALEAQSPRMQGLPDRQEEAFTHGVMRTMGQDGLATPANVGAGSAIGDAIGNIRRSNEINPTEFPRLNQEIGNIVRRHRGTVGPEDAQAIAELQNNIRMGAAGTTNVASMPGRRYDYMRQRIQDQIDKAATGTESRALSDVRAALDAAFHRSIPDATSEQLRAMETQYANYNALKNRTVTPGKDTISPEEAARAAAKHFGNANVNQGGNQISTLADNASRVMEGLPKPTSEVMNPLVKLLGMAGGYMTGAGVAAAGGTGLTHAVTEAGPLGAIAGREAVGPAVDFLKNAAGRVVARPGVQSYLKNQAWLPGNASTAERDALIRLLASPEFKVTDQSK